MSSNRSWLSVGIKSFNGKVSLTFLFLLLALPAFAAGGACPSGANYTNPANPAGSLVTLSSLGVTSCYYVAANGSDTNNGTSESSPFLHSPGMANCSSNCASVTLASGLGVIFRGGDTWHFGNSSASPYAGVASRCADNGNNAAGLCLDDINATSSNPIYYGVDKTWKTGGSWARPILTADNPLCNSGTTGTMPDGATCTGTTDWYGQPSYYVSSCGYQVGGSNVLVDVGFSKYIIVDNFEITSLCQSHTGQPTGYDDYVRYGSAQAPIYFTNLYLHGASHLQFAAKNGTAGCTSGTVCTNIYAFSGAVANGSVGETIANNVVDFADSDPGGEGLCFGGFYNVAYNVFRYTTQCLANPLHLFHDNLYEYFFENGHSNMLEDLGEAAGANAIYNNVFRHIEAYVTSGGGVGLWQLPASGTTDYFFNNLMYDVGNIEYINVGNSGSTLGNYTFFNNTFQTNPSQPILRCEYLTGGALTDTNNHFIDDGTQYLGPCNKTTTTPLLQSNAQADANVSAHFDQYAGSESQGYSPVASTNSTVIAGTNVYTSMCGALGSAGLTTAQTACESNTTYACSYAGNGAGPVCPAGTVNARPSSTVWDVGAYEFNSLDPPPNAPTGLTAIVN
ncbi:MAG: hypothetical protein WB711_12110 [Terriglobales bacterium]